MLCLNALLNTSNPFRASGLEHRSDARDEGTVLLIREKCWLAVRLTPDLLLPDPRFWSA